MAILAISPSLLASNRPVFWMLWASVVFLLLGLRFYSVATGITAPRLHPKFKPILGLSAILALFMSLQAIGIIAETPRASVLALFRLLTYLGFFWLMATIPVKQHTLILSIILATVTVYALYGIAVKQGILPMHFAYKTAQYSGDITSSFINRNSFALYIGMGIMVNLTLIARAIPKTGHLGLFEILTPKIVVLLLVSGLLFVTLILSNSRMGFAAVIFGSMVFLIPKKGASLAAKLTRVSIICAGIGVYVLYNDGLNLRFLSLQDDLSNRLQLFAPVWQMILSRPFTGFGADSFQVTFAQFQTVAVNPALTWDKAHNTYLTNWSELGLIFGSIPLIILIYMAQSFIKSRKNTALIRCAFAVLVQNFLHSTVDFGLEIQANVFLFLAILGLSFAEITNHNRR